MFISFNDPLDICIWIDNLENGRYEVLTYALTPGDPDLESRVRVDFADEGPVMVGGAWPGAHVEGISYARHTLDVVDGEIGLHSGLQQAVIQSGINGIQISRVDLVGAAEASSPPPSIPRAYPNPFGSLVTIDLGDTPGVTTLNVIDVAGRLVRSIAVPQGSPGAVRRVVWDGRDAGGHDLPAGVYFVRAEGQRATVTRKLVRSE
jgi:hypothetical protein